MSAEDAPRAQLHPIGRYRQRRFLAKYTDLATHSQAAAKLSWAIRLRHQSITFDTQRISRLDDLNRSVARVSHMALHRIRSILAMIGALPSRVSFDVVVQSCIAGIVPTN